MKKLILIMAMMVLIIGSVMAVKCEQKTMLVNQCLLEDPCSGPHGLCAKNSFQISTGLPLNGCWIQGQGGPNPGTTWVCNCGNSQPWCCVGLTTSVGSCNGLNQASCEISYTNVSKVQTPCMWNQNQCISSSYTCNGNERLDGVTSLYLDPAYVDNTKQERNFDPRQYGMTMFDDVICEVKIQTGLVSNPSSKILSAELTASDPDSSQADLLSGQLSFNETKNGFDYFQWKILGWQTGWAPANTWGSYDKAWCSVKLDSFGYAWTNITVNSVKQPINPCVKLHGPPNSKIQVVSAISLDNSNMNPQTVISRGWTNFIEGFSATDPFKTYIPDFEYFADIKASDARTVWTIPSSSTCGGDASLYITYDGSITGGSAYLNSKVVYVPTGAITRSVMHETGHAFCGVLDEYPIRVQNALTFLMRKNCVMNPHDFITSGFAKFESSELYGDADNRGDCFVVGNGYIPSDQSFMNFPTMPTEYNYNVITGGYCLNRIMELTGESIGAWNIDIAMTRAKTMDLIPPEAQCYANAQCIIDKDTGMSTGYDATCISCAKYKCQPVNQNRACINRIGVGGHCDSGVCI